jgi:hypothetical protein
MGCPAVEQPYTGKEHRKAMSEQQVGATTVDPVAAAAADTVGGNRVSEAAGGQEGLALVATAPKEPAQVAVATSPAPDVEAAWTARQGRSAPTAEGIRALVAAVDKNPALVEFPVDPWGFTRELRKVGLAAASAVKGQADKHITLLGTLMVLTAHVKARVEEDQKHHKEHQALVERTYRERNKYTRNYGMSLPHKGGIEPGNEPTDPHKAEPVKLPLNEQARDVDG